MRPVNHATAKPPGRELRAVVSASGVRQTLGFQLSRSVEQAKKAPRTRGQHCAVLQIDAYVRALAGACLYLVRLRDLEPKHHIQFHLSSY